jgi:hypothetical protein
MDIVERLRDRFVGWRDNPDRDLKNEAADEIERLRQEFRELHMDIKMFMEEGPLKEDILKSIEDVLGEDK